MDGGSSLIFIGLAVAWAAYLLPVAIRHHHESDRSRPVDTFTRRMRVLARREPVDKKSTALVTPTQQKPAKSASPKPVQEAAAPAADWPAPTQAQLRARRAAAKRATKRRRNVLALLLVANLTLVALAWFMVVDWPFVAIPAGLLVAWLVACRLMVKRERADLPAARMPVERPAEPEQVEPVAEAGAAQEESDEIDPMVDTSAGIAAIVDPEMWDPVPVTLPTYVGKPAATRRTVRTIDLDATGVWTSGRTDADAQLAREADEADKAARKARRDGDERRATGS